MTRRRPHGRTARVRSVGDRAVSASRRVAGRAGATARAAGRTTERISKSRGVAIAKVTFTLASVLPGAMDAAHLRESKPAEQRQKANEEGHKMVHERRPKGVDAIPGRTPPGTNRASRRSRRRLGRVRGSSWTRKPARTRGGERSHMQKASRTRNRPTRHRPRSKTAGSRGNRSLPRRRVAGRRGGEQRSRQASRSRGGR